MEKISRIIAPSPRTQSYDVARAQPGRPGAPQLGRPMDTIDRVSLSDQFLDPILNGDTFTQSKTEDKIKPLETYGPKESFKAQAVKEMTNNFFLKGADAKSLARGSNQTHSEETAARVQSSMGSNVKPDSSSDVSL